MTNKVHYEIKIKWDCENITKLIFETNYLPNSKGWRDTLYNELVKQHNYIGNGYKDIIENCHYIHVLWKTYLATYNLTIYPNELHKNI